MTPDQLAHLTTLLEANRQPVDRKPYIGPKGDVYIHPQGWNDCLDFVKRSIKEVMGETGE